MGFGGVPVGPLGLGSLTRCPVAGGGAAGALLHEEGGKMRTWPAVLLLLGGVLLPHCRPLLSSLRMAAILDERSGCGRGERLALALAREQLNGARGGPPRARLEVDIFELQRDSQYETTDTSERT
ncbi:glutamate receptor ionotropic, kainate 5-like, partial [Phasianus colchicus]